MAKTVPQASITERAACKKNLNRRYQLSLRDEVFRAYGNECVCCHEKEPEFLNLDHVNGGGTQERQRYGGGRNLWLELRRKGFPKDGYQLLCANCHQAKKNGKVCPHQRAIATGLSSTVLRSFELSAVASAFVDKQCAGRKFETPDAYVTHLIEEARMQRIRERLTALIDEALKDPDEAVEATEEWWEQLKKNWTPCTSS